MSFGGHVQSFLLDIYQEIELLGYRLCALVDTASFSKVVALIYAPFFQ